MTRSGYLCPSAARLYIITHRGWCPTGRPGLSAESYHSVPGQQRLRGGTSNQGSFWQHYCSPRWKARRVLWVLQNRYEFTSIKVAQDSVFICWPVLDMQFCWGQTLRGQHWVWLTDWCLSGTNCVFKTQLLGILFSLFDCFKFRLRFTYDIILSYIIMLLCIMFIMSVWMWTELSSQEDVINTQCGYDMRAKTVRNTEIFITVYSLHRWRPFCKMRR